MPVFSTLVHSTAMQARWRLLLWLLMAVTCVFAFAPNAPGLGFDNSDKIQHLLAFGSLAACALLSGTADRRTAILVMAAMLGFGVFIELVQAFLPTRTADWQDVVADMLGAGLGVLAVATARRLIPVHVA
jgi:VanZ family protein